MGAGKTYDSGLLRVAVAAGTERQTISFSVKQHTTVESDGIKDEQNE